VGAPPALHTTTSATNSFGGSASAEAPIASKASSNSASFTREGEARKACLGSPPPPPL